MNKKGLLLKIALPVLAILLVFLVIGGASQASGDKNEPFLAKAGLEFGIICNFLNQTADMETNFAVLKYQPNGQWCGNTISKDKANAAGRILAGEIVGKTQFRHEPVIIEGEEAAAIVKDLLASIKSYSSSVVDKSDYETPVEVKDQNSYTVDITDIGKETVYVNADPMVAALNAGRIQNGGLKIKLREDQTLVFNIKENKSFEIPRYSVEVLDGKKDPEEMAKTIIWNMPNLVKLAISSDKMHATIIAPNAMVNLNVTGEGWLVCDTIVSNSGEWHMIYQDVPEVTPTPAPTKKPKVTKTPEPTKKVNETEKPKETPIWSEDVHERRTPPPVETADPTDTPEPAPTKTPLPTENIKETEKPTATPIWSEDVHERRTPPPVKTAAPTSTPMVTDVPEPTDTPTMTPAPTQPPFVPLVTPTPLPTSTPVVTDAPASSKTPEATGTAEPTSAPDPTRTPVVTDVPDTPDPVDTPKPDKTPDTDKTPGPAKTPKPTDPPESTGIPVSTPTPAPTQPPFMPLVTPTPLPTNTPAMVETPLPTSTSDPLAPSEATTTPDAAASVDPEDTPLPSDTPDPFAPSTEITETEEPDVTLDPSAEPSVDPDATEAPLTTLDDDDTPLGKADPDKNKKSTTTIPDNEVPLADASPKTGDSMNFLFPILAMGLSLMVIIGVMIVRKKR